MMCVAGFPGQGAARATNLLSGTLMLAFLQKFHRHLNLLLLILAGLACGHLAAVVLAGAVRPPLRFETEQVSQTAPRPIPRTRQDLESILQRNPFNATERGRTSTAFAEDQNDRPDSATPRPARNLALVGTLVAGSDSMALIGSDQGLELYHLGEEMAGGGEVTEIERKRVTVRYADQSRVVLELAEDEVPSQTATARRSSSDEAFQPVGDNRWQISRAAAEAARADLPRQLRLAQIEPRIIDQQTHGFTIRMLNPRSVLTQMGLRRGDVILGVNGMQLNSPEQALQILQQLREARRITVDIERGNRPLTLVYEIN